MKLQLVQRSSEKKSETKRLRREGFIPAILYVNGKPCEAFALKQADFAALMRQVKPGRLATMILTLELEKGKARKAIIKEIQYDVTSYTPIHIDFEELQENVKVNVNVPIEFVGVDDCVGVKLGGVLRQVIRNLKVRCLPKDIPACLQLDVSKLEMRQSKRLSALELPKSVKPCADLNEVAVVIAGR